MTPSRTDMPPDAMALLRRLQQGQEIAVPSVYLHSLSFSDHARLYFDNAVAVSRPDGVADFRIFSVLYNLRHGLELWLKCLLRNRLIDSFLQLVFAMPDAGLEELANELGLSMKERVPFQRSLCCLRNNMVDGIKFPEANPWEQKMEVRWANRALDFLRGEPDLPRSHFAMLCHARIAGHDLCALWNEAEHLAASFIPHGLSYSECIDVPPPSAEVDEIGALARLLNYYDPDGDAFRYPSSLDGRWHSALPHLDLVGLGELARRMHDTVLCVSELRSDAYERTTVSQPSPFVVLGVV